MTSESSYGGDAQAVGAGGVDLCSMSLPAVPEVQINHTYSAGVRATSQYVGTGFLAPSTRRSTPAPGLAAASRDNAGIQTSFEYDALGRVTWSKPDPGQGGWTQYLYAAANPAGAVRANVTVRRRDNGSKTATILGVNLLVFDYFGRVYQEQRRLPGGAYNKRETIYDGSGNKASVSELTGGAATNLTSYLNYDPFGRPATIQPPDGASHNVTMTYAGVRGRSAAARWKVATAVGSGDLWRPLHRDLRPPGTPRLGRRTLRRFRRHRDHDLRLRGGESPRLGVDPRFRHRHGDGDADPQLRL